MNPDHIPGNEPDTDDMNPDFDADAEVRSPATPGPGEEEADAIGDFA